MSFQDKKAEQPFDGSGSKIYDCNVNECHRMVRRERKEKRRKEKKKKVVHFRKRKMRKKEEKKCRHIWRGEGQYRNDKKK